MGNVWNMTIIYMWGGGGGTTWYPDAFQVFLWLIEWKKKGEEKNSEVMNSNTRF